MSNDTIFVDKHFVMDPRFDDLLFDGTELREGMIVLIEDSLMRATVPVDEDSWDYDRALECNRWCTVGRIKITPRYGRNEMGDAVGESSPLVSFIAIYPDGTKRKRQYDASYSWIVKKDTM